MDRHTFLKEWQLETKDIPRNLLLLIASDIEKAEFYAGSARDRLDRLEEILSEFLALIEGEDGNQS